MFVDKQHAYIYHVEHCLEIGPLFFEGLLRPSAFDRMMNDAHEHAGTHFTLYQIILGPFADRLDADLLVIDAGKNNDGLLSRDAHDAFEGVKACAIRQG